MSSLALGMFHHCRMATFLLSYQIVGTSSTWTADVGRDVPKQYWPTPEGMQRFWEDWEDLISGRCDMPITRT